MNKQDRQGVRTAAGLEQKYQWKDTFDEQAKELLAQQENLLKIGETVDRKFATVDQSIKTLDQRLDKAEDNAASVNKTLGALSLEMDARDQKLAELSKETESLDKELTELKTDTEALDQRISETEDDVTELQQALDALTDTPTECLVSAVVESLDATDISADRSFAEIEEAINGSRNVRVKLTCASLNHQIYMQLASHYPGAEVIFYGYYDGKPVVLQIQPES